MGLLIAVDGTAGSGKTTLAKKLARSLGAPHLSAGLLYRFAAWTMTNKYPKLPYTEGAPHCSRELLAAHLSFVETQPLSFSLHLDGIRLPSILENESTAQNASFWAEQKPVVETVHRVITNLVDPHPLCVIDGREIAAAFEGRMLTAFYVDAPLSQRSHRCQQAQESKGITMSQSDCARLLSERDARDASRYYFPFTPNPAAVAIYNTMKPKEAVEKMLGIVQATTEKSSP